MADGPTKKKTKKKQKVLHTRVSEELEQDLKSKAAHLGISVSNLVRNVLLNTVDLVETVVVDSARIADSARGLASPTAPPPHKSRAVVGWQELTLNLNAICARCNEILRKGEKAAVAVPISDPPSVLCPGCLPSSGKDGEEQ
jgi:hypothetical protein